MSAKNGILWVAAAFAMIFFISASGNNTLPANALFNLNALSDTYGADNVERLIGLYLSIQATPDPNTGQPLNATQMGLLLSQALHESGLFTNSPNYNNIDNLHNFAGIKANSRYAAAPGSMYAYYPTIDNFSADWINNVLNHGAQPIEATSVPDFVNRLVANHYFEDNQVTYQNDLQNYYNILQNIAV